MTKKTPQQKIAELDERRAKVEGKLKREREAITRAKRREQANILNQNRKEDTRRKILIGALRFDDIDKLPKDDQAAEKRRLKEQMNRYLTRKDDRALFGLPLKD
jgi:hypothetical protein